MWIRPASLSDLNYCLKVDALAGVSAGRTRYMQTALDSGICFVTGRSQEPEGVLISGETFFSRPFVSLLFVAEPARRLGLASGLMAAAEARYSGKQLFTSTNQSNVPMQMLLHRRGYLSAGVVLHLDAGDPELVFMKQL
jgi:GNAT superfamily N-acetyltransferase